MSSEHRTKGFASLFITLALIYMLAPSKVSAQQKRVGGRASQSRASRQTGEKDSARRLQAINLLVETANGARSFKDMVYRARIQMLAADALWPYDEDNARLIFRRAWEAASAADRAEQRAEEEAVGLFSNSDEVTWTATRDEVLSKAAGRDQRLADAFLRELVGERERAEERRENQSTRRTAWRELSPMGMRRLALAYEFLNRKELIRAAAISAPLLAEGVTGDLMEFILRLRANMGAGQTDPYRLYLRLLEKAATNPYTDGNDLLLLSSYFISPQLLMVVDEKGSLQFRSLPAPPIQSSPNEADSIAAKAFYKLAITVLLQRPSRAANPVQDRTARYVATGRLIPFLEKAGPEYSQFVPVMRSQLSSLSSEMEAARRTALDAQFEVTSLNRKNASDPLAPQLAELTRAVDKQERDRLSLLIARRAARERLWDRAQRAAYGIEDASLRRAALSYIVVNQIADITRAYKDDKEDDFESVARFVRRADAPPFASAWGLAQAAMIAGRKDNRDAVSALLSEAESYAARADKDSRQRVAAYIVITEAAARLKSPRAWDFLSELVRAANSTTDYFGDETTLPTSSDMPEGSDLQEELMIESEAFRLDRIFATMARIDFDKTMTHAQALTGDIPRALARIAAARTELEKKY